MGKQAMEKMDVKEGDALLVVDVQNCFLPGGSLGVPGGDAVISPLNAAIAVFTRRELPVFFSRDWHPADHCSFREQGGPWPVHCVQDTDGASFAPSLQRPEGSTIVSKATVRGKDEYSAMGAKDAEGNTLDKVLRKIGAKRIFAGGLATDYCVLNTVRDALGLGYEVYVLVDAIRAVDVNPGDGERAVKEMGGRGATMITTEMLPQ